MHKNQLVLQKEDAALKKIFNENQGVLKVIVGVFSTEHVYLAHRRERWR
jgi:hypothetical protein